MTYGPPTIKQWFKDLMRLCPASPQGFLDVLRREDVKATFPHARTEMTGDEAMPPIEIGDWMSLGTEYRTDVMHIPAGYNRVGSDIEADAFNQSGRWHRPLPDQQPPDITEIRKANGTVWTREPRR